VTAIELSPAAARAALSLAEEPPAEDAAALMRYATVVWCHLTEPGDSAAGALVARWGPAAALERVMGGVPPAPEMSAASYAAARSRWVPRLSAIAVADSLRVAGARGIRLITRADPEWPEQLEDLGDHAPLCLWVRGDPGVLGRLRPSVALVGARAATAYGDHVAMELSADLAGGGVPIASGGAYGIDGAAHRAALAVGGTTVALLAGGADRAYPAGHTRLIDDIARTGAVVSEVPCGSAPTKWRFLQRNRLIAAIADATVVVEAGWRSGSLNTAGHAAALGRQLGAVPGPVTSAASAGTHRLLRDYAATCVTSAADVREMLGLSGAPEAPAAGPPTDHTTRVRDALSTRTWRDAADIARRAGLAPADAEAILGLLHLDGSATRTPAGWRLAPTAE
jgi:DNA processing protein